MGKKLIYQVDMTHGGAVSGWPPVVIIETTEDVNIGKVTVRMGNGQLYPAHLVRVEERDPVEEIRAGNNQRLNRIYGGDDDK